MHPGPVIAPIGSLHAPGAFRPFRFLTRVLNSRTNRSLQGLAWKALSARHAAPRAHGRSRPTSPRIHRPLGAGPIRGRSTPWEAAGRRPGLMRSMRSFGGYDGMAKPSAPRGVREESRHPTVQNELITALWSAQPLTITLSSAYVRSGCAAMRARNPSRSQT